jgi:hypothetical protein
MDEIIRFPAVFQTWEKTEAIIRKNLHGYMPSLDEEFVVAKFKEVRFLCRSREWRSYLNPIANS